MRRSPNNPAIGSPISSIPPPCPWPLGFALGVLPILPILLILWIRRSLQEPDSWGCRPVKVAERSQSNDEIGQRPLQRRTAPHTASGGRACHLLGCAYLWEEHIVYAAAERDVIATAAANGQPLVEEARQSVIDDNSIALKRKELLGISWWPPAVASVDCTLVRTVKLSAATRHFCPAASAASLASGSFSKCSRAPTLIQYSSHSVPQSFFN
ncbi:MAG: hypothetical protein M2R45_03886 [Verrucomicrobia subdivision 3 bacterium]|nr:hypothetical protein [Limisphaerales bacterium]MCS1412589.1 hypothetical protein [Limisphaerales bacterium]